MGGSQARDSPILVLLIMDIDIYFDIYWRINLFRQIVVVALRDAAEPSSFSFPSLYLPPPFPRLQSTPPMMDSVVKRERMEQIVSLVRRRSERPFRPRSAEASSALSIRAFGWTCCVGKKKNKRDRTKAAATPYGVMRKEGGALVGKQKT